MLTKKDTAPVRREGTTDPFALLRQMTAPFDRLFEEAGWPSFRWPLPRTLRTADRPGWYPGIDVFEKDSRLITKVDLPGVKKEDVKVEVADGQLVISGERRSEVEEKKEQYYRAEREYGSFYRAVPLPEGVTLGDVKATFADGVLEVSVPLPAKTEPPVRRVQIDDAPKAKTAA